MVIWASLVAHALAWDERGPSGVPTGRTIVGAARFRAETPVWGGAQVVSASSEVGLVARAAAAELREQHILGSPLATAGVFSELGYTLDDTLAALDRVAQVADEDRSAAYKRLEDPAWLAAEFDLLRWVPDRDAARARNVELAAAPAEIRLTNYVVYQVEGRDTRSPPFETALYALPDDEADGVPGLRMKYSRMDVYGGVYEPGGEAEGRARPLVWLTRDGANQALMQGTIEVTKPDGTSCLYNVHENNGVPYDPRQKDLNLQARFWYCRPVSDVLGVEQIRLRTGVAVAGDVYNLGLGKLVALEFAHPDGVGRDLVLAVLADTGGAFQPNLFQLDWFAGPFPSEASWRAWAAGVPSRVPAWVLVRRRTP